jgi:hypothetical protein
MKTRAFGVFVRRLKSIGLLDEIEKHAANASVSLRDLYSGDPTASVVGARRAAYQRLHVKGKSVREIARLFDRAPSGVHKLLR